MPRDRREKSVGFSADLQRVAMLREREPTTEQAEYWNAELTPLLVTPEGRAAGRSETWVADRTGHRSSVMINAYRRASRHAAELGLGELAPLDRALVWREESAPNAGRWGAGNQAWRKRAG
jgi:hypothetical protein